MPDWISGNWVWLVVIGAMAYIGWFTWPRMKPNARRFMAGGMGITYLAISMSRLAAGAPFNPLTLARAVLMGLGGLPLLLAVYKPSLAGGWVEIVAWAVLGGGAIISLLFRESNLLVQGLVFLVGAGLAVLLQLLNDRPVSEWENPGSNPRGS
jgi:hypothetical protein